MSSVSVYVELYCFSPTSIFNMRFSLSICFLVLLGAVCLSSGDFSTQREKRFIFTKILKDIKQDADKVSKFATDNFNQAKNDVNNVVHTVTDTANNAAETVTDTANTVSKFTTDNFNNAKNDVNSAVKTASDFVNDQVKQVQKDFNDLGYTINGIFYQVTETTGNIIDDGIHFVVGATKDVKKGVEDVAKVTVKLAKKANEGIDQMIKGVKTSADKIINETVDFVATVESDAKNAVAYTIKEGRIIEKGVATIAKKVYRDAYNEAQKEFAQIKQANGKVDFDKVVLILIHFLGSPVADAICEVSCISAASYFLGPWAAFFAELLCAPLCAAALAKLEDVAEKIALKAMKKKKE